MTLTIINGHVHGLGTIRVEPEAFGSPELTAVAKELLEFEKTKPFIYGPIRVYGRGPKDLRLEYPFKVSALNYEVLAKSLHGQVQNLVLQRLKIKGRWNHNHWLGIELVS